MSVSWLLSILILVYSSDEYAAASRAKRQSLDLSQVNLTTLADNYLFTTWRPIFHFASPNSWMNDPCAPLYNPATQNYHLYYQVQPGYVEWGNISWGHAKSKDMITWQDVTSWQGYNYVALAPGVGNNQSSQGVFTGSGLPISMNGSNSSQQITIIYTSVKYLPLTVNNSYVYGSETQSLAVSSDDGVTFQEYSNNPILASSPPGLNVTGWRDPKFDTWPRMDTFLYGSNQGNYYMTLSSGIQNNGSRLFLYQAPPNNLANWTYLGPLIATTANYSFNQVWSGSFGYDFEVSNTFSLLEKMEDGGDGVTYHDYATLGTERGNTTLHQSIHWSLWVEGNLTNSSSGSPMMNILATGVSDWGDSYACNSFHDTINDRRIYYGWVTEANNDYGERAFGYNGQLTLPREVFVLVYQFVLNSTGSLPAQGPWTITPTGNGTFTCKTLGVRPIDEVVNLRNGSTAMTFDALVFNQTTNFTSLNVSSISFELQVVIEIVGNATAGLVLRRSGDGSEYTTLFYDPVAQYLILNRTCSSLITQFVSTPVYAKHGLLTLMEEDNATSTEPLSLRIFVDNSLIEVYANNRTAIATHIYPTRADASGLGYFVGGQNGSVTFGNISMWSNLSNAFPLRPANSSIALVSISTTTNATTPSASTPTSTAAATTPSVNATTASATTAATSTATSTLMTTTWMNSSLNSTTTPNASSCFWHVDLLCLLSFICLSFFVRSL